MNNIKNILICGLGAIGSIYATTFNSYKDIKLKILVDKKRLIKYKNTPLIFNEKKYDFDYITPDCNDFKADLIIISTKNNHLEEVINNIKNFVYENTLILSLLNGLQSEELIAKAYGNEKIIDSYYIGHTSTRLGRKIIHDGVYKTVFGEENNSIHSKRILKIKQLFEKTNIPYEIPVDMKYSKWWKYLVNVGYNQASAILNASYGDFQKCNEINDFAINLMQEATLIAQAEGVKNTENIIPEILEVISKMLPETRTSMLQDIDAKRETEIEAFAGYILKLAKKHNINTPYNEMSYKIIKALDSKLKC